MRSVSSPPLRGGARDIRSRRFGVRGEFRAARRGRSVCTPSPSMNVRNQSSRFINAQIASPPATRPSRWLSSSRATAAGLIKPRSRVRRSRSTSRTAVCHRPRVHWPNGTGKPHLLAREDLVRQQAPNRFAEDPLGREAAQLEAIGQARGELDEHVIEEGHAAFDRGRHAHLILFHQQLDEVRLHVRVEQAPEHAARAVHLAEVAERRGVRIGAAQAAGVISSRCICSGMPAKLSRNIADGWRGIARNDRRA